MYNDILLLTDIRLNFPRQGRLARVDYIIFNGFLCVKIHRNAVIARRIPRTNDNMSPLIVSII